MEIRKRGKKIVRVKGSFFKRNDGLKFSINLCEKNLCRLGLPSIELEEGTFNHSATLFRPRTKLLKVSELK